MSLRWKKINEYCIGSLDFTITKAHAQDQDKFILWHKDQLIKIYKTSKEAKHEAMALNRTEPTLFD